MNWKNLWRIVPSNDWSAYNKFDLPQIDYTQRKFYITGWSIYPHAKNQNNCWKTFLRKEGTFKHPPTNRNTFVGIYSEKFPNIIDNVIININKMLKFIILHMCVGPLF